MGSDGKTIINFNEHKKHHECKTLLENFYVDYIGREYVNDCPNGYPLYNYFLVSVMVFPDDNIHEIKRIKMNGDRGWTFDELQGLEDTFLRKRFNFHVDAIAMNNEVVYLFVETTFGL